MIAALIVAAGRGTRAETDIPKQYVKLDGVPVLRRSIEKFLALPTIDTVTVVIGERDDDAYQSAVGPIEDPRLTEPVTGGNTRASSVQKGLLRLAKAPPAQVLIHDAARPFVETDQIQSVIDVLNIHDGAFVAVPTVDAMWRTDGGFAISPVDRKTLWRAQTPQGFRFQKILAAHQSFKGQAADDVEVARASGMLVQIVEGSEANFKITTPADMVRATAQLADQRQRGNT